MGAEAAHVTQRQAAPLASKTAAASGPVQAIVDVATFKAATPAPGPRKLKAIRRIDKALRKYIETAGPNKLVRLNALNAAIGVYLGGNHNAANMLYVQNTLQPQVNNEITLINAL